VINWPNFLSQLFNGLVLGALLAIPVTLLLKAVLVDSDPRTQWVEALLGSELVQQDSMCPSDEFDKRGVVPIHHLEQTHLPE